MENSKKLHEMRTAILSQMCLCVDNGHIKDACWLVDIIDLLEEKKKIEDSVSYDDIVYYGSSVKCDTLTDSEKGVLAALFI
jgi:hypothetical protein